jgi:hypothetical protein
MQVFEVYITNEVKTIQLIPIGNQMYFSEGPFPMMHIIIFYDILQKKTNKLISFNHLKPNTV